MLGDSTVGKSSLLKRYTEDLFLESINQTVGVDFYVHFLEVEPGVRVKLQFWDTAGQERFRWGSTRLVTSTPTSVIEFGVFALLGILLF